MGIVVASVRAECGILVSGLVIVLCNVVSVHCKLDASAMREHIFVLTRFVEATSDDQALARLTEAVFPVGHASSWQHRKQHIPS